MSSCLSLNCLFTQSKQVLLETTNSFTRTIFLSSSSRSRSWLRITCYGQGQGKVQGLNPDRCLD